MTSGKRQRLSLPGLDKGLGLAQPRTGRRRTRAVLTAEDGRGLCLSAQASMMTLWLPLTIFRSLTRYAQSTYR